MTGNKTYRIELSCDYEQWWRYNVYIMVVGFDAAGKRLGFTDLADHVRDAQFGEVGEQRPGGYDPARVIAIESSPCARAEAYIYIVANTFPRSGAIKDSPPFEITLSASADGRPVGRRTYEVNQWGGLAVVAYGVG